MSLSHFFVKIVEMRLSTLDTQLQKILTMLDGMKAHIVDALANLKPSLLGTKPCEKYPWRSETENKGRDKLSNAFCSDQTGRAEQGGGKNISSAVQVVCQIFSRLLNPDRSRCFKTVM